MATSIRTSQQTSKPPCARTRWPSSPVSLGQCGNAPTGPRRLNEEMEAAPKRQQVLSHILLPGPKGDGREGRPSPPPIHSPREATETRTVADFPGYHPRRPAHLHSTHRVAPFRHGQKAPMLPGAGGESVWLQKEYPTDHLHLLHPSYLQLWRRSLP